MTFTSEVRDELAHVTVERACCRRAETAASVRLGATFQRRGGEGQRGFGIALETTSGAVARRLHSALREVGAGRPEISVIEPGGLRRSTGYLLVVGPEASGALVELGVLDDRGRPATNVPAWVGEPCDRDAYLRGLLLMTASISKPGTPAHLEMRTASEPLASSLVAHLRSCGAPGASMARHRDAWRVVVKSGAEIGELLARAGGHTAFLAFDHGRLHRELRLAANRAANADRANLARAVGASTRQAEAIERVIAQHGWTGIDDELRAVALARLANPEASLAELGELLEPPVGKSAVHRRIQRLLAMEEP